MQLNKPQQILTLLVTLFVIQGIIYSIRHTSPSEEPKKQEEAVDPNQPPAAPLTPEEIADKKKKEEARIKKEKEEARLKKKEIDVEKHYIIKATNYIPRATVLLDRMIETEETTEKPTSNEFPAEWIDGLKKGEFGAIEKMKKGDRITKDNVMYRSHPQYISSLIKEGFFAQHIAVATNLLAHNILVSGQRVDIRIVPKEKKKDFVPRIFAAMKILAMESDNDLIGGGETKKEPKEGQPPSKIITIEVKQSQIVDLVDASNKGEITFTALPLSDALSEDGAISSAIQSTKDDVVIIRGIGEKVQK